MFYGFVWTVRVPFNIPREEAVFGSTELSNGLEDDGNRSILQGRVGPYP